MAGTDAGRSHEEASLLRGSDAASTLQASAWVHAQHTLPLGSVGPIAPASKHMGSKSSAKVAMKSYDKTN